MILFTFVYKSNFVCFSTLHTSSVLLSAHLQFSSVSRTELVLLPELDLLLSSRGETRPWHAQPIVGVYYYKVCIHDGYRYTKPTK